MSVAVDITMSGIFNRFTIGNLQRLHRYLSNATNHLTSYYNPQLLCWIACMLIDIMTFVFSSLYGNTRHNSMLLVCSRCMMILYLSLQIIAISRICHLTCDQVLIYYNILMSKISIIFMISIIFLMLRKIVLG